MQGKNTGRGVRRFIAGGVAAALCAALLVFMSACGGDQQGTQASAGTTARSSGAGYVCDKSGPSIIPRPTGKPQLVYFFRDTWPGCQQQKPIVDELQQQYQDRIEFIRLDMNTPEASCEYNRQGLTHLPAMLFMDRNGAIVDRTTNVLDAGTLQQKLENLLGR